MSSELEQYSLTLGAVVNKRHDESGLPARVVQALDQRDAEHLAQFGHLPGAEAICTLRPRGDAVAAALAGARAEQRGAVVDAGSTQNAADTLNQLGPWLNVFVTGEDPEVARGRAKLAADLAALQLNG